MASLVLLPPSLSSSSTQASLSPTPPAKRMKIEQEAPVGEALPSGGDKKGPDKEEVERGPIETAAFGTGEEDKIE